MTENPKQPLFNRCSLLVTIFILVIIFLLSATYGHQIFPTLTVILFVNVMYLVLLRYRLIKKKAALQLQTQEIRERMNLTENEIKKEAKVIESIKNKIVNYAQLKVLTEKLSMSLYLEETSHTLVSEVNKLFGGEATTIILYLFHSAKGELGISSSQKGQVLVNLKSKKGDSLDHWVIKTMQPLLIEDTKTDYRFDLEEIQSEDTRVIRSLISVPLLVGHKPLGILRLDSSRENDFGMEDLRLLTTIGDVGAVAVENAQLFEHVEQLAIKDSLTGLYLRRYFLDRVAEEINRHLRHKEQMSFLMIDLDHFKSYNDSFGHMAGDIVLKKLGDLLTKFFNSPGYLVCRFGGEEFAVLLTECPKPKAIILAQAIRKKIEEETILLRREKTRITVSVGVASFPKDAQFKEELIHKADQALYQAKVEGRNRVSAA